jgi:hypothetical protein
MYLNPPPEKAPNRTRFAVYSGRNLISVINPASSDLFIKALRILFSRVVNSRTLTSRLRTFFKSGVQSAFPQIFGRSSGWPDAANSSGVPNPYSCRPTSPRSTSWRGRERGLVFVEGSFWWVRGIAFAGSRRRARKASAASEGVFIAKIRRVCLGRWLIDLGFRWCASIAFR